MLQKMHIMLINMRLKRMFEKKLIPIRLLLLAALTLVAIAPPSSSRHSTKGSQGVEASQAVQTVLLDTTELSSLEWTSYKDLRERSSGWVEESFTNFDRGINWRSFVVCDVASTSVNNWLWTPFIERQEASRLYIEIKFTMRDCKLFPQDVRSCKETFALLYKESDLPISSSSSSLANASFAQSDSYQLIDAIAADAGRFTSGDDVVINTEIRSVPVTKRGVYFAFRDQGACLSLISIKVYHLNCPKITTNLAQFNSTPTGKDLTSLVAVEGQCVPNSAMIEQPKLFCAADGNWNSMSSGQCKCLPGYEPAATNYLLNSSSSSSSSLGFAFNQQQLPGQRCLPCQPGKFKPSLSSELQCQSCPDKSSAPLPGSSECRCHEGYYRLPARDSRSSACTQPPSEPINLTALYVDSNTIILQWSAPKYTGGRDDLTYKLICDQCDPQALVSSPQYISNFSETKCVLSGLSPSTSYRLIIYSMNGVSHLAAAIHQRQPSFSEITVQTLRPMLQSTSNTLSAGPGGFQLLPIYNFRAIAGVRGTDMILTWDTQVQQASLQADPGMVQESTGEPSLYEIRYQPRLSPMNSMRRSLSPYPLMQTTGGSSASVDPAKQQQSITTTNKAVAISTLSPSTEYAFQIRAKWAHANQWTEFSEPIYMTTTSQMPSYLPDDSYANSAAGSGSLYPQLDQLLHQSRQQQQQQQQQQRQATESQQSGGWLSSFFMSLMCLSILLAIVSLTLIHSRHKLGCPLQAASFGSSAGGSGSSTYGGVYGSGAGSGLIGGLSGGPLGFGGSPLGVHHHATLSAGSAGGLITGSNRTSRGSSGNVVQNFLAATLGQIGGGNHHAHHNQSAVPKSSVIYGEANGSHTLGGGGLNDLSNGKLFASPGQLQQYQQQQQISIHGNMMHNHHQQQQPRNHYHQTLGALNPHPHTVLMAGGGNGTFQPQAQQQQQQPPADLFKYRTLSQNGAVQFIQQQDPQTHIYDDLDNACYSIQRPRQLQQQQQQQQQQQLENELDPQRIVIKSAELSASGRNGGGKFLTDV